MLNLKKIDRIAGGSGRPKACGFVVFMAKRSPEKSREYHLKYKSKFPEKRTARNVAQDFPVPDGMCRHHWSYRVQHRKDVIHLLVSDHQRLHRLIVYDQDEMMYRRKDTGSLLITRRLHEEFIKEKLK